VRAADAGPDRAQLRVAGIEMVSGLVVELTDGSQAALEAGNLERAGAGGQVVREGFWSGGQRSQTLLLTPRFKVRPIGGIGALRAFRTRLAGVVLLCQIRNL